MKVSKYLCFILVIVFSSIGFTNSGKTVSTESLPALDDIRCERASSITLAEFKTKLVENCNLNKPFSTSASRLIDVDTYFYCCHKR